jgi:hypothetical protein
MSSAFEGGFFSFAGLQWLLAAMVFGPFAAFHLWFDFAAVRARKGVPFPDAKAVWRTSLNGSLLAAFATVLTVPAVTYVLFRLGTEHVPVAGPLALLAAALTLVAAIAGAIATFRARSALGT